MTGAEDRPYKLYLLLLVALALNISLWMYSHRLQPKWANVPPAPAKEKLVASFLGDEAFAYRVSAFMLQNFGNTSGPGVIALKDYNYDRIGRWLYLLDSIDPKSNYVPFIAAYYFGATPNAGQLDAIIEYLAMIGKRQDYQKWRWLAHGVYLARHQQKNMEKARLLAHELAQQYRPGMPLWTKQLEGIISHDMGDKEASYDIMMGILTSNVDTMHPNEINYMQAYICDKILNTAEAAQNPLCQNRPGE